MSKWKKVGAVFLLLLALLAWGRYDARFTPERWAQTAPERRGKLTESLLKQYNNLEGMTRAQVEELLGPDAEGEQYARSLTPTGSEEIPILVYLAGGRLFAPPEYLMVYLKNDTVTQARVEWG